MTDQMTDDFSVLALSVLLSMQSQIHTVPVPRDANGKFDFEKVSFFNRRDASKKELAAYDQWMAEHRDEMTKYRAELGVLANDAEERMEEAGITRSLPPIPRQALTNGAGVPKAPATFFKLELPTWDDHQSATRR
jgi:hypothetical protein